MPRTNTIEQVIVEMDQFRLLGWRGHVFFVHDNLIGNKSKLKKQVLATLIEWMDCHNHPFSLSTEASLNLSDDEELMHLMGRAGFESVFVGIENQQICSRLLPGASGGEISGGSFFQQNPHWLANRMPMPWQNGHSRYSGSGPNASKLISSFHFSVSSSVVPEGSPILTCASLDISQSNAVTTERR
jgi:hypothetical protein